MKLDWQESWKSEELQVATTVRELSVCACACACA